MVHDTAARQEARGLKKKARELAREARALEGIEGAAQLAEEREVEMARLREQARELQDKARLEDITVRQEPLVKQTKMGEMTYYRWVASWREGGRCKKVYLGSTKKMSQAEAMQKAREMKAKALGYGKDGV
ncbi:MAG: hypothetical protein WCW68_07355 [Methanothrix sp.]